jgi:hypothetical protein
MQSRPRAMLGGSRFGEAIPQRPVCFPHCCASSRALPEPSASCTNKSRPQSFARCPTKVRIIARSRPEQYSSSPAKLQRKDRGGVNQGLTQRSSGRPPAAAHLYVRPFYMKATAAPRYAPRVTERISSLGGSLAVPPRVECELRAARAARPSAVGAPPTVCRELSLHSQTVPLVKQSLQNAAFVHARCFMQEPTATILQCSASGSAQRKARRSRNCRASTPAVRQLVSKRVVAPRSWWRQPRPNPFIEGMPKSLRLLCTPHVKR